MATLTERATATGGVIAVYCARVKIGYLAPAMHYRGRENEWIWELILRSDQYQGHPRGWAESKEAALARLDELWRAWCRAADLVEKS